MPYKWTRKMRFLRPELKLKILDHLRRSNIDLYNVN